MTSDFEVLERLMQERRSERQFLADELEPSVVDRLLEVAASAPSANNRQPYRFMVVTRRATIARMVAVVEGSLRQEDQPGLWQLNSELSDYVKNFRVFEKAPVVVVVFFRSNDLLRQVAAGQRQVDEVMQVREALSSAAAAIMQLLLAAHALGLGACWMTGPCLAEQGLLALLEAPPGLRIAALVPIGRCAERSATPRKRRVAQLRLAEPAEVGKFDCPAPGGSPDTEH